MIESYSSKVLDELSIVNCTVYVADRMWLENKCRVGDDWGKR